MQSMAAIDLWNIKSELLVFLRNADVLTTSERGVTTTTEEFDGNGSTTTFDVSNTNLKNVRSVTVDGSPLTFGTDYTVDYDGSNPGRVTTTSPPGSGTDNVDIQYDYGTTDKIFPDWPKASVKLGTYPRIAIDIIGTTSEEAGFNDVGLITNAIVDITVFANKTKKVDDVHDAIRTAFLAAKKDFYYFDFLTFNSQGPLLEATDRSEYVLYRNTEYEIINMVELT